MKHTLTRIKEILNEGKIEEGIALLNEYLKENSQDDEAYYLLGNFYRRKEDWKMALNNFQKAMDLNPESPAAEAYKMIVKILEFYNKDIYNH
jgi:cytochrome c-type biogenesis protein CcmH/NrfG